MMWAGEPEIDWRVWWSHWLVIRQYVDLWQQWGAEQWADFDPQIKPRVDQLYHWLWEEFHQWLEIKNWIWQERQRWPQWLVYALFTWIAWTILSVSLRQCTAGLLRVGRQFIAYTFNTWRIAMVFSCRVILGACLFLGILTGWLVVGLYLGRQYWQRETGLSFF